LEKPAPPTAIDPYEDFATYDRCYATRSEKPCPTVQYCGFEVRFKGNRLLLENAEEFDVFVIPEQFGEIIKLENRPYGLQISLKNGDQYCLVGGPMLHAMYMMCLVKGA
jgi:hypothetical protein